MNEDTIDILEAALPLCQQSLEQETRDLGCKHNLRTEELLRTQQHKEYTRQTEELLEAQREEYEGQSRKHIDEALQLSARYKFKIQEIRGLMGGLKCDRYKHAKNQRDDIQIGTGMRAGAGELEARLSGMLEET